MKKLLCAMICLGMLISSASAVQVIGDPDAACNGNFGAGTSAPATRFHVKNGVMRFQGISGDSPNYWDFTHNANSSADYGLTIGRTGVTKFEISNTGSFVVNDSAYQGGAMRFGKIGDFVNAIRSDAYMVVSGTSGIMFNVGATEVLRVNSSGNVGVGTSFPSTKLHVAGEMTCAVANITGGSDLCEQFDITGKDVKPGMVVSMDPAQAGKLVVSSKAYDRTVAGVVSGAGGLKPGLMMGQQGSIANGKFPVALTGRVYVMVDATKVPVQMGDLLTTSNTPGHAMKASNYEKAQGAIIGKAMTSLKSGKGLVMVLVTLK
ncbi:hypothetical protein LLG95_11355 [bacterium]|nr:hypothetical protein [bacterium]